MATADKLISEVSMHVGSDVPRWVQRAGQLAPLASIAVFLAPIPTIHNIHKNQSVGSLPLLPYSSMIGNCFLWVVYGILRREAKLWSCNLVGLMLGVYYFRSFVRVSPTKASTLPGTVSLHVQGIAAIVVITIGIAVFAEHPSNPVGNLGVAIFVAMFASPLAAVRTVLENKSAKSIPLPFTIASVVHCSLWGAVGLLEMTDAYIYMPSLIGLFFGLLQVWLKLRYRNGATKPPDDESSSAATTTKTTTTTTTTTTLEINEAAVPLLSEA